MTCLDLFEKLDVINDAFIAQAEISPELLTASTPSTRIKKSHSPDFWNSPWFVAVICATVALCVLGGIIWAGNRPDTPMVAGTQEDSQDMLYETEAPTEAVTQAETQTTQETEEQATQIDTEPETQADTSNEVTYETNEDGLYIIMEEPYVWESFTPSATQLIQQIDVELPEGVTMRRTAVYHQAWIAGEHDVWYVLEVRQLTDREGNRSIHLIFRDPKNSGQEIFTYSVDIGKGYWGLVQDTYGMLILYYTGVHSDRLLPLTAQAFYLSHVDAMTASPLDGAQLDERENYFHLRPINYTSDRYIQQGKALWNKELYNIVNNEVLLSNPPSFRMIADDLFGEFAFFGDENMETEGFERLQKFILFECKDEVYHPTYIEVSTTAPSDEPDDPIVDTLPETTISQEPIDTNP